MRCTVRACTVYIQGWGRDSHCSAVRGFRLALSGFVYLFAADEDGETVWECCWVWLTVEQVYSLNMTTGISESKQDENCYLIIHVH
jgi:hypothetical protein